MTNERGHPVVASVPGEAEAVQVLRALVAGVAGAGGFDLEAIDDLRLATTEAASMLLTHGMGATIDLSITIADQEFEVVVWMHGSGPWPPQGPAADLATRILEATMDTVDLTSDDQTRSVRLVRRMPAS